MTYLVDSESDTVAPESDDDLIAALNAGIQKRRFEPLERLYDTDRPRLIETIIAMLDHSDIRVRGEAFGALMGNRSDISDILIRHLDSPSSNVRGFLLLVLANREDMNCIPKMTELTRDDDSMVRTYAKDSLEFLAARGAGCASSQDS